MSSETEKLTINLGVVELAQIDVLVEQGIYSNRSDLIRTAIRKQLETHSDRMELQLTPTISKPNYAKTVGIMTVTKMGLEKLARAGETMSISVIGMLIINNGITAELFETTVDSVLLRGKLIAPDEIKDIINHMNG